MLKFINVGKTIEFQCNLDTFGTQPWTTRTITKYPSVYHEKELFGISATKSLLITIFTYLMKYQKKWMTKLKFNNPKEPFWSFDEVEVVASFKLGTFQ